MSKFRRLKEYKVPVRTKRGGCLQLICTYRENKMQRCFFIYFCNDESSHTRIHNSTWHDGMIDPRHSTKIFYNLIEKHITHKRASLAQAFSTLELLVFLLPYFFLFWFCLQLYVPLVWACMNTYFPFWTFSTCPITFFIKLNLN